MKKLPVQKLDLSLTSIFVVFSATFFCCLNLIYFIAISASPLIRDDAWYFLDSQIKPWIEHGFTWADLFLKRGLTDHAQPLNKLFLYFNYRYLNLDFRYEAISGFIGLLLIILIFVFLFIQKSSRSKIGLYSAGAFLLAVFIITSLNATEIYTWPLVTFSYIPLFLGLIVCLLAWNFLRGISTIWACALTLTIFVLVGDTAAIILWITLTLTVLICAIGNADLSRGRILCWILFSGFWVLAYFLVLNHEYIWANAKISELPVTTSRLNFFDIHLYIEIIRIVFSFSVVHLLHLSGFGKWEVIFSWVVALPILFLYFRHFLYFLIARQQPVSIVKFATTFLLVFATVSVLAIVVGRVPVFGVEYLRQPRYVFVYQLIPFALFMNMSFGFVDNEKSLSKVSATVFSVVFLAVIYAQIFFASEAYRSVKWISRWTHDQIELISSYVNNPSIPSGSCSPLSQPICSLPVEKRNELLNILREGKLNFFNHEFQWTYGLFPTINVANPEVSGWGPQSIRVNSSTGVWIKLSRVIEDGRVRPQVKVNNILVDNIVFTGDVITFVFPDTYADETKKYLIECSVDGWKTTMVVGEAEILK